MAGEASDIDLRVVFDRTPTPCLLMTRDFAILDMNAAYLEVMRRDRSDLIGRPLFETLPSTGDNPQVLEASLRRVLDSGITDVIPLLVDADPDRRSWSVTHVPIRGASGDVAYVLQNGHPVVDSKREDSAAWTPPAQMSAVLRQVETVQALNQSLLAEKSFLRGLFMKAPSFMCVLHGATYRFELVNAAFTALVGDRDLIGETIDSGLPELREQALPRLLDKVFTSGEPHIGQRMRVLLQRSPGASPIERFLDIIFQPMLEPDGSVGGIFIEGSDVTDHVMAEQRQSLLIRELHHRVRNTLATVQGVMNSTARTAATIEDYQSAFAGRIASLARTHALLTEEIEQSVSLRHLIEQELKPYVDIDSRIRLQGPAIDLPSQIGVPLGMTIHELTTNATRHGALRVDKGRLDIRWDVKRGDVGAPKMLRLTWRESEGPVVSPPVRAGFGSMLLTRVLAQQIGVEVETDYAPEGFSVTMSVPLPVVER